MQTWKTEQRKECESKVARISILFDFTCTVNIKKITDQYFTAKFLCKRAHYHFYCMTCIMQVDACASRFVDSFQV